MKKIIDALSEGVDRIESRIDRHFENLLININDRFDKQDTKIDQLDAKMSDRFEKQDAVMNDRFEKQDARIDDSHRTQKSDKVPLVPLKSLSREITD